ncbi:MAG: uroporphyrinogen decarboxylase [Chloroflexi bacterium]|nr:uroporphyrinogen decarboxylase [Chloroflexota bacterium]
MWMENWDKLTPAEKLQARFKEWKYPEGAKFASSDVECAYQERVQLFQDALELKKPKRVPLHLHTGFYPAAYAGVTPEEAMYDYEKLGTAMKKFNADFLPDSLASAMLPGPAKAFDLLDMKLYRWPTHGVDSTAPFQCVESEYMREDEYDLLIADPTNFFLRRYFPRIFGNVTPWQKLPAMTDMTEWPLIAGALASLGNPEVQAAFDKFLQAARAAFEWVKACGAINAASVHALGLVPMTSGFSKAPFDTLGDTLRGTRGIMLDKFHHPEKILKAVEQLVPSAVEMAVRAANNGRKPLVTIPLHKGADGFMSEKDFKTYYWPTLKKTILGIVNEGVVPLLFVEGSYNSRLDIIVDSEIPKGTTLWMFDKSDMKRVKEKFSGWQCIGGNVPVSILATGTPEQVKDYVKRLIDDAAVDGGFILSTGAVLDDAQPANLHAMLDTGRAYGVYQ